MLFKQSLERVTTGQLNRLVKAALEKHPPPMHGMVRPKIYYATQVGMQPPTIVLMCNEPRGFSEQYRRFLLRVLRDNLKFGEVPIKMYLQRRRREDKRNELGVEEDEADKAVAMEEDLEEEVDSELDEVTDEE